MFFDLFFGLTSTKVHERSEYRRRRCVEDDGFNGGPSSVTSRSVVTPTCIMVEMAIMGETVTVVAPGHDALRSGCAA